MVTQLRDQGVDAVEHRTLPCPGGDLGHQRGGVREQRTHRTGLSAEVASRLPGDHPCPGGVLTQERPGQGELALGLVGAQPP